MQWNTIRSESIQGTSLVVHWLRLGTSTAGSSGSIPGQGTKIMHAVRPKIKVFKTEKMRTYLKDTG